MWKLPDNWSENLKKDYWKVVRFDIGVSIIGLLMATAGFIWPDPFIAFIGCGAFLAIWGVLLIFMLDTTLH